MKARDLLTFAAAAALAACSSVTAAYERDEGLACRSEGFEFDKVSIEDAFRMREQLVFPARVAVFGLERNEFGRFSDVKVAQFEKALAGDADHFGEVLPLPAFLLGGGRAGDLGALRMAAARVKADVLLLYEQDVEVRQSHSPLQVLNLLILPAWLVPTTPFEVALETSAALVDVRNGLVYLTLHDVRTAEGWSPSASLGESARTVKDAVREEAFVALRDELRDRLVRLAERGAAKSPGAPGPQSGP